MMTQTKDAPTRLVFQTQAWNRGRGLGGHRGRHCRHGPGHHLAGRRQRLWTATADVAHLLFRDYVLPFEVVSVLLTAAVVGAVYLARREPSRREEDRFVSNSLDSYLCAVGACSSPSARSASWPAATRSAC